MKRILVIGIILSSLYAVRLNAEDSAKVIAYYFHSTARCATCRKIENLTEKCLKNNFGEAMSSGKLVFKSVNIDHKENEHFISDYGLYTKSVVLSLVEDGREIKSNNLEKIWKYVQNEQKFTAYVQKETRSFLDRIKRDVS